MNSGNSVIWKVSISMVMVLAKAVHMSKRELTKGNAPSQVQAGENLTLTISWMKESVSTRHQPASFAIYVSVAGDHTARPLALANRVQMCSWQSLYAIYQLTKSEKYRNFYSHLTTNIKPPWDVLEAAKKWLELHPHPGNLTVSCGPLSTSTTSAQSFSKCPLIHQMLLHILPLSICSWPFAKCTHYLSTQLPKPWATMSPSKAFSSIPDWSTHTYLVSATNYSPISQRFTKITTHLW